MTMPRVKEAVSTSLTRFCTSLSSIWSRILLSGSPVIASRHRRFHLVFSSTSASIIIIMRGADLRHHTRA